MEIVIQHGKEFQMGLIPNAFRKCIDFSGRSRRKEYFYFMIFNFVVLIILQMLDFSLMLGNDFFQTGLLSGIYSLLILIPSLSVLIRRLHDTSRSAWWILVILLPLIGPIVLLVFICLDSHSKENKYGLSPKEVAT